MSRERDWSAAEIDAIVTDYFEMLFKELTGQHYVKAEHRRALLPQLDGRTEGSIEMKHCNISAVLDELGYRYIDGYKPRKNVQESLRRVVGECVRAHRDWSARPHSRSQRH